MTSRTLRAAVTVLAAAAFLCPEQGAAVSPKVGRRMPLLVPVAAGPPVAVTTEASYDAFPYAVPGWVAYSHGTGHVSATSDLRLRRIAAGKTWSAPTVVASGSDGYGTQTGGLALESTEQGGRLWLGVVRYKPTGPVTATEYTTTVRSLDAGTGLWSQPTALPAISTLQTIGTGLLVRPDGTLLAAAYGTPAGATYSIAKVYTYDRAAGTWSTLSTVSLASRHVQEPTLLTMADGRLLMLFRSDATAPYYCYIYATVSADGGATWGTPYWVVKHGSGMPHGYLAPDGSIAVTYRGFTEPQNPPAAYPPRVAMLNPDGTATSDGAIDVTPGITARYLYGRISDNQFVYAVEGAGGQTGQGAAIYSTPIEWVPRTE